MDLRKSVKYDIYVGLIDQDDYTELISVNSFTDMLTAYCTENRAAFSLSVLKGGYAHNKGYVIENSLKVELIGADYDFVKSTAQWLKEKVNTDTVMITKEDIFIQFT